jgi:hypothetical protein
MAIMPDDHKELKDRLRKVAGPPRPEWRRYSRLLTEAVTLIESLEDKWEKAQDAVRFAEQRYEEQAAVLEALTSDDAVKAGASQWARQSGRSEPCKAEWEDARTAITLALQHAQEQVGNG